VYFTHTTSVFEQLRALIVFLLLRYQPLTIGERQNHDHDPVEGFRTKQENSGLTLKSSAKKTYAYQKVRQSVKKIVLLLSTSYSVVFIRSTVSNICQARKQNNSDCDYKMLPWVPEVLSLQ
jgi:hypothetical protein